PEDAGYGLAAPFSVLLLNLDGRLLSIWQAVAAEIMRRAPLVVVLSEIFKANASGGFDPADTKWRKIEKELALGTLGRYHLYMAFNSLTLVARGVSPPGTRFSAVKNSGPLAGLVQGTIAHNHIRGRAVLGYLSPSVQAQALHD
ncbi:unnamed protein product, partial [Amoebophrya sp. A120]